MSDEKHIREDPERTLVTLDQLSQTIEVMTSVVNRLRRHLSEQIKAQLENQVEDPLESHLESLMGVRQAAKCIDSKTEPDQPQQAKQVDKKASTANAAQRESFVVEINQQEAIPLPKSSKVLH